MMISMMIGAALVVAGISAYKLYTSGQPVTFKSVVAGMKAVVTGSFAKAKPFFFFLLKKVMFKK